MSRQKAVKVTVSKYHVDTYKLKLTCGCEYTVHTSKEAAEAFSDAGFECKRCPVSIETVGTHPIHKVYR